MAAVAAAMASYGAGDGRRRAARLTALALGSTLLLFGLAIGNGLIHRRWPSSGRPSSGR